MAALLLRVYFFAEQGDPVSKKDAWKAIGIEDARTGRKYLSAAIGDGLLLATRSQHDKRKELLLPTKRLNDIIKDELAHLRRKLEILLRMVERSEEVSGSIKSFYERIDGYPIFDFRGNAASLDPLLRLLMLNSKERQTE